MTPIGTTIFTLFFGDKVGTDEFGNRYYRSKRLIDGKNIGRANTERRWVIYNGMAEPSKIPPYWHGWLHYISDDVPDEEDQQLPYRWSKAHLPHLTGTKLAYYPQLSSPGVEEAKPYQAWDPQT